MNAAVALNDLRSGDRLKLWWVIALGSMAFGSMSAEFWFNLQTMHDLTKVAKELGRQIERDVQPRVA